MEKMIYERVTERRHGRNQTVGLLVGVNENGTVRVCWSRCNFKAKDTFKMNGPDGAIDRAINRKNPLDVVPPTMKGELMEFVLRCQRYFKGCQIVIPPFEANLYGAVNGQAAPAAAAASVDPETAQITGDFKDLLKMLGLDLPDGFVNEFVGEYLPVAKDMYRAGMRVGAINVDEQTGEITIIKDGKITKV